MANSPVHLKKRPVVVVEEKCVGCLTCIGSCPTSALNEIVMPPNSDYSPLVEYQGKTTEVIPVERWGRAGLKWA